MAQPLTIYRGSLGLNNVTDPARLGINYETGETELAVAVNVDHDKTGRISRRKGYAATAVTANSHSLWCDGGVCLFVSGTSLYELHNDYRSTALATVTAGARVSYLQLAQRAYWMNGYEKGYIEAGSNNDWVKGTYIGPDTTRAYSDPPIGSLLAYHGGRIFVAQANTAWYSERYSLNAFDLSRGFFMFPDAIRMMLSVTGGMYIGTDKKTYWIEGRDAPDMNEDTIADYPPIEGTAVEVNLGKLGVGDFQGVGYMWTSTKGVCVAGPGGLFLNLTERKLTYPGARYGAGTLIADRYVATLQP